MRIAIAGGTGFLGTHLSHALIAGGHDVVVLTRRTTATKRPGLTYATWQPDRGIAQLLPVLTGVDAIVNLAGESIASGRWTTSRKQSLRDSRVQTTRLLVEAARTLPSPPRVWLNGSAVGYYGSRGDERLTEDSRPGNDFLSSLAVEWETAASAAGDFARVVLIRTGIVLDAREGALPRMLLPFRLFVGGPLGSGEQYMSWIHRDDWISLAVFALERDVSGPLNATSPEPVTNAEFSRALARVLHRPSLLPAPAFALRLLLGETADALLLASQRVLPARAEQLGFEFGFRDLELALRSVLGRTSG